MSISNTLQFEIMHPQNSRTPNFSFHSLSSPLTHNSKKTDRKAMQLLKQQVWRSKAISKGLLEPSQQHQQMLFAPKAQVDAIQIPKQNIQDHQKIEEQLSTNTETWIAQPLAVAHKPINQHYNLAMPSSTSIQHPQSDAPKVTAQVEQINPRPLQIPKRVTIFNTNLNSCVIKSASNQNKVGDSSQQQNNFQPHFNYIYKQQIHLPNLSQDAHESNMSEASQDEHFRSEQTQIKLNTTYGSKHNSSQHIRNSLSKSTQSLYQPRIYSSLHKLQQRNNKTSTPFTNHQNHSIKQPSTWMLGLLQDCCNSLIFNPKIPTLTTNIFNKKPSATTTTQTNNGQYIPVPSISQEQQEEDLKYIQQFNRQLLISGYEQRLNERNKVMSKKQRLYAKAQAKKMAESEKKTLRKSSLETIYEEEVQESEIEVFDQNQSKCNSEGSAKKHKQPLLLQKKQMDRKYNEGVERSEIYQAVQEMPYSIDKPKYVNEWWLRQKQEMNHQKGLHQEINSIFNSIQQNDLGKERMAMLKDMERNRRMERAEKTKEIEIPIPGKNKATRKLKVPADWIVDLN